jgi:hypothetical protein
MSLTRSLLVRVTLFALTVVGLIVSSGAAESYSP